MALLSSEVGSFFCVVAEDTGDGGLLLVVVESLTPMSETTVSLVFATGYTGIAAMCGSGVLISFLSLDLLASSAVSAWFFRDSSLFATFPLFLQSLQTVFQQFPQGFLQHVTAQITQPITMQPNRIAPTPRRSQPYPGLRIHL